MAAGQELGRTIKAIVDNHDLAYGEADMELLAESITAVVRSSRVSPAVQDWVDRNGARVGKLTSRIEEMDHLVWMLTASIHHGLSPALDLKDLKILRRGMRIARSIGALALLNEGATGAEP
jgi:hypothetical protein